VSLKIDERDYEEEDVVYEEEDTYLHVRTGFVSLHDPGRSQGR
jgi:hypothetical protein